LRIRFRDKVVALEEGVLAPSKIDLISRISSEYGVFGWRFDYVIMGNEPQHVDVILDEHAEFTVGDVTKKVGDALREKNMTLHDVAQLLRQGGVAEVYVEV
jgi:hypothetical protein